MKILFVINSDPYANENAYNAIRIGLQFMKEDPQHKIYLYLIADGVNCAVRNEKKPAAFFDIENKLEEIVSKGADVTMCTSCGNARHLKEKSLNEAVKWGSLNDLTTWVASCDKILSF